MASIREVPLLGGKCDFEVPGDDFTDLLSVKCIAEVGGPGGRTVYRVTATVGRYLGHASTPGR